MQGHEAAAVAVIKSLRAQAHARQPSKGLRKSAQARHWAHFTKCNA